ncbi:hypothetical protein BKI49_19245 [Streptomyces sp. Tue6028]|nr:hypothetical protein BKI49_19245 [Streptomyces sp. Tue6028]
MLSDLTETLAQSLLATALTGEQSRHTGLARGQGASGTAGVVQHALADGWSRSGQGLPGLVVEDAFGVLGEGYERAPGRSAECPAAAAIPSIRKVTSSAAA